MMGMRCFTDYEARDSRLSREMWREIEWMRLHYRWKNEKKYKKKWNNVPREKRKEGIQKKEYKCKEKKKYGYWKYWVNEENNVKKW